MYWIQRDYYRSVDPTWSIHPVYGYPCWDYDFSSCITFTDHNPMGTDQILNIIFISTSVV